MEFGIARPTETGFLRLVRSLKSRYPRAAARFEVRRCTAGREPAQDRARIETLLRRLAAEFGLPLREVPELPHDPLRRDPVTTVIDGWVSVLAADADAARASTPGR